MKNKAMAIIMDKAATSGSYIASIATAIGGFLSLNNIALLLGIASTVALFVVQYRRNKATEKRDQEYHTARMAAIKQGNLKVINMDDGNE
ncbi:MAG: HP1 family phage holin [Shewanella sp.]